jgi:hypothetical protein
MEPPTRLHGNMQRRLILFVAKGCVAIAAPTQNAEKTNDQFH